MNNFFDLVTNRRSIRKYTDKIVEEDKIEMILNAALMSPSSKHSNSWEFIVVNDNDMLKKLSNCKQHGSQFLANAPLGIVVIAEPSKSDIWMADASIASTIIQLQAHSLGLGSCWIQVCGRGSSVENVSSEDYIKNLLRIPNNYVVLNIISIGYPAETKKSFQVDSLEIEKIHHNKF